MSQTEQSSRLVSCSCGKIEVSAVGEPLLKASCYCTSCQAAGQSFAQSGQLGVLGDDGGTPFVMYRKDRMDWSKHASSLREHRLTPESSTRRVSAVCCGTPLFLEFEQGHWLSLYAQRVAGSEELPTQIRTMTRDAPPGTKFDDGIPSPATHTVGFMARLFWAWLQMGFRAPKIEVRG